MNILFTAAGRRAYLIDYFQKALNGKGLVIATNSNPNSTALLQADKGILVPESLSDGYIDKIIDICLRYKVKYIFSLHDIDGLILSKHKGRFEEINCRYFGPEYEISKSCLDKYMFYKRMKSLDIKSPFTTISINDYLNNDKGFPAIIKPRYGFGSSNIFKIHDKDDLLSIFNYLEKNKDKTMIAKMDFNASESAYVIQEFIEGKEFGITAINNFNDEYVGQYHIEKNEMRCGETYIATSCYNSFLEEIGEKICKFVKYKGIVDCDIITRQEENFLIEINPRFGGQYPFSHVLGGNLPEIIINNNMLEKVSLRSRIYKKISIEK